MPIWDIALLCLCGFALCGWWRSYSTLRGWVRFVRDYDRNILAQNENYQEAHRKRKAS